MTKTIHMLVLLVIAPLAMGITAIIGCDDEKKLNQGFSLPEGNFQWQVNQPILWINPKKLPPSPDNPWYAVKDPSIVRYQDKWHLFCSLRKTKGQNGLPPGYIRIGYMSFTDWKDAPETQWHLLDFGLDYHGAPQVFYFTLQKKWYLVYQYSNRYNNMPYGPYYSTTTDITDPSSWTPPAPFYLKKPASLGRFFGLDFWIICDSKKAHLFFTRCNGTMWRAETRLQDFPNGFGQPEVALRADIFEASHTYRIKGLNKYLTLIEAQGSSLGRGHRYQKAYISDALDGKWKELAASLDKPFAAAKNIKAIGQNWADSVGHGELVRAGYDERLEIDPENMLYLFQGVDRNWSNPPFRLGLLKPEMKQQ